MVRITRVYTRTGDQGSTHLADLTRVSKTDPRVAAVGAVSEANACLGLALASLPSAPSSSAPSPPSSCTSPSGPPPSSCASPSGPPPSSCASRSDVAGSTPVQPGPDVPTVLQRLQHQLFCVGADLTTPLNDAGAPVAPRISPEQVVQLESECDHLTAELPPLDSFVLPGGTETAARLHLAATVLRRAELAAWVAAERFGVDQPGGVNSVALQYLNRVSDLVFLLARQAAWGDEVMWEPPCAP